MEKRIDTSEIKVPDETMLWAVEQFALGKKREQIAAAILNSLPDALKILSEMDRGEAKALLCSRLRQADPTSTKFASKYMGPYNTALKSANDVLNARMRHTIAARVHSFEKIDEVLSDTAEKLGTHLENCTPENIGSPETLNCIKTLLSVCKTLNQNTKEMASFVETFEAAQQEFYKLYYR